MGNPDLTAAHSLTASAAHLAQATFKRLDVDIRAINQQQVGGDAQVQEQVQKQLAQALLALSKEFRQEQTRFLNKARCMGPWESEE